nr:MAG TPA: hypothetical protein [Caudoviricetes sp.]
MFYIVRNTMYVLLGTAICFHIVQTISLPSTLLGQVFRTSTTISL